MFLLAKDCATVYRRGFYCFYPSSRGIYLPSSILGRIQITIYIYTHRHVDGVRHGRRRFWFSLEVRVSVTRVADVGVHEYCVK